MDSNVQCQFCNFIGDNDDNIQQHMLNCAAITNNQVDQRILCTSDSITAGALVAHSAVSSEAPSNNEPLSALSPSETNTLLSNSLSVISASKLW